MSKFFTPIYIDKCGKFQPATGASATGVFNTVTAPADKDKGEWLYLHGAVMKEAAVHFDFERRLGASSSDIFDEMSNVFADLCFESGSPPEFQHWSDEYVPWTPEEDALGDLSNFAKRKARFSQNKSFIAHEIFFPGGLTVITPINDGGDKRVFYNSDNEHNRKTAKALRAVAFDYFVDYLLHPVEMMTHQSQLFYAAGCDDGNVFLQKYIRFCNAVLSRHRNLISFSTLAHDGIAIAWLAQVWQKETWPLEMWEVPPPWLAKIFPAQAATTQTTEETRERFMFGRPDARLLPQSEMM